MTGFLNCIVTKYMIIQGRETKFISEHIYPWAILNYDRKKNVCVITLYQLVENGEREGLYVAFYGFSSREDALAYFKAVKK